MKSLENVYTSKCENKKRIEFFENYSRNIKENTEKNNISLINDQLISNGKTIHLLGILTTNNSKVSFSNNTPTNKVSKLKHPNDNLKNIKFNIPKV
jgi:hypothetical protein